MATDLPKASPSAASLATSLASSAVVLICSDADGELPILATEIAMVLKIKVSKMKAVERMVGRTRDVVRGHEMGRREGRRRTRCR